ncbi:MAG: hypothetical protein ACTTJK_01280 [Phocaeicola sp.]|uniref:hypothetical protein n=1 Tax=Phocaeicola sp. TaxID=2773926 RepID=UPI003FA104A3
MTLATHPDDRMNSFDEYEKVMRLPFQILMYGPAATCRRFPKSNGIHLKEIKDIWHVLF